MVSDRFKRFFSTFLILFSSVFQSVFASEIPVRSLLLRQQSLINEFFNQIDPYRAQEMVEALYVCKGSLIFSGVGKSGIIADKIAKTFTSFGIRSYFLHPIDALHGDIGSLSEKDMIICLSKSGKTQEMIQLMLAAKKRKSSLMIWTCKEDTPMEQLADYTMILPLKNELCPFNLSPTTSPTLQLIFGDIVAIALMKKRQLTTKQYAQNHPAGAIGSLLAEEINLIIKP